MSPHRLDYIIPFGSGARGWVILSSPPSLYTFRSPGLFSLHLRLGTVLTLHPINSLSWTYTDAKCFTVFTRFAGHSMGRKRTGIIAICPVCQKSYPRPQHNIDKGTQLTCSFACNAIRKRGEGNHFFGRKHSAKTRKQLSKHFLANPSKGTGPKKGIFKHTEEAKAKMSAALRERWRTRRADMLSYIKRGLNTPYDAINPKPRWKVCFTRAQKRDWVGTKCAWCNTTKDLVLDHIIPVICGGINERTNAQTLCLVCNRWKMRYVDRPLYFALTASDGG